MSTESVAFRVWPSRFFHRDNWNYYIPYVCFSVCWLSFSKP